MKFKLLIEDCSCSFCYILSFKILNNVDKTEIFLFSERWFVSEWEFIVKNMIAIVKWVADKNDLNCKCINDINIKKMLYY